MPDNLNCTSCGDGDNDRDDTVGSCGQTNPNPLDPCTRSFMQCDNPCAITLENSVQCESLPSRVENFTKNFFGDVIRTEVNGVVTWSLPCGLDVGLPSNPRGLDEGLACYFLRLFNDGIVGLIGDPGKPGAVGPQGHNAFTVVLRQFNTPAVGHTVTVNTLYNPGILVGSFVFVDTSGWYQVVGKDLLGNLTLLLIVAAPGSGSTPAGKLIVPSGEPGQSIPGQKGDKGDTGGAGPNGQPGGQGVPGLQGVAGNNLLANNGSVNGAGQVDYPISANSYTVVNFGPVNFSFQAPNQGTYLVSVTFDITGVAVAGGNNAQVIINNTTNGTPVLGAYTSVSSNQVATNGEANYSLQAIVSTTGLNQLIEVQAKYGSGASSYSILAASASLSWFQID